jgi:hypothetical protein
MNEIPELFTEKDKVQILLHEYDSLRLESQNRTSNGFQLVAIAGALFVWLATTSIADYRLWIGMVVTFGMIVVSNRFIYRDIRKAATRLREIERDINSRVGEDLLVWESRYGCDVTGYITGAKPLSTKK